MYVVVCLSTNISLSTILSASQKLLGDFTAIFRTSEPTNKPRRLIKSADILASFTFRSPFSRYSECLSQLADNATAVTICHGDTGCRELRGLLWVK